MISFEKKFIKTEASSEFTKTQASSQPAQENRFEEIRKAAAERHRKADTDGTRRRARQTAEDNRLL